MTLLPPYISREMIHERLPLIFPEGSPNRNYCIREMAASTIFVMLYIGAIEGENVYIGPVHIYRMTGEQAAKSDDDSRRDYGEKAISKGFQPKGVRWYADNTREPIRDETLREGLIQIGAVISRQGLATTSSKPRYMLKRDFAALFDPTFSKETLKQEIKSWQEDNLSASARARLSLAGRTSGTKEGRVLVTFPNSETRILSSGPSSDISKAVIEVFAPQFLIKPAVLWLSTSDTKVTYVDDSIATTIGLKIESDKNLPDIILVDLAKKEPLFIFIEVVATDGPVSERRKQAINRITDNAGFNRKNVTYVTAYRDRQASAFRKTISELAWGSFAWFMSEPDKVIYLNEEKVNIIDFIK